MSIQTATPYQLLALPKKDALVRGVCGKTTRGIEDTCIRDRPSHFAKKLRQDARKRAAMGGQLPSTRYGVTDDRPQTAEGTRLQLGSSAAKTNAVVVSTMMEAWKIVESGLVTDGIVKDILYGLPVAINKIADLSALWDEVSLCGAVVRLIVDHPKQVEALEAYEKSRTSPRKWSVFVKVDGGQKRAGVSTATPEFEALLTALFTSPAISIYGFYCHAGNAYASTSLSEASSFLSSEVEAVNVAAERAKSRISQSLKSETREPFVLSVGSTPTAHSASAETRAKLSSLLHGTLELHAGNYPVLDLQQLHTSLIDRQHIAQRVLATVISYYPGRGDDSSDEAMCDAGCIAMSKDTGPSGGFGEVIGKPWRLGRISQEHGILTRTSGDNEGTLEIGSMVQIVGQHACLIAAAYPWYYVVDSDMEGGSDKVVDIWVPWKGW
ncbi:hypothetical protein EW146_g1490 [Bondarzewia mesenterica]|uniref:D-serine dehydratase n=1 Tax=Bondarzewia mesenterica TaxID=1095465 RepID=A0A4S4M3T3_9AGAM|nr:hypothetical protein EW146_g1490 [Bondarzewia mesenterica]